MTKDEFVRQVLPVVKAKLPDNPRAQRIVIAHAAFETGWGKATPFVKGNNLFNITRTKLDPRPIIKSGDLEYAKDGTVKKITQRFAAYPTIGASVDHYLSFIDKHRYRPALEYLKAGELGPFVDALYRGGYFTLPPDQYLARLSAIYSMVSLWCDKTGC